MISIGKLSRTRSQLSIAARSACPIQSLQSVNVRARQAGVTFTEILFAILILGIGAIMLAGVFPVAIEQSKKNSEEGNAAAIARGAMALLTRTMNASNTPPTNGVIVPLQSELPLWQSIQGNVVASADPSFAWAGLYSRDTGSSVARVNVFVLRCRARSSYQTVLDTGSYDPSSAYAASLEPRSVAVDVTDNPSGQDTLRFTDSPGVNPSVNAASPGAYVLIASTGALGETAGRVYRLGELIDATQQIWSLDPGMGVRDATENLSGATAYLVGRGYADPTAPASGYDGHAQDVAMYASFVLLP